MADPQDNKNTGVIPPNPLSGGVLNPGAMKSTFTVPEGGPPATAPSGGAGGSKLPPNVQQMIAKGQTMGDELKGSITSASSYGKNQFYYATPRSINADQFERYYSHPAYDRLGYSPWRNNEQIYNDNSSGWADFRRASGQWWNLFGVGFKSSLRSWGDLFEGKPFKEDIQSAKEFQHIMQIGASSRGGVSGFMTNTWLNSGYTFGVMGEMLAEEAVLAGATAITAGGDAEVTLPAMGARFMSSMGKIGKGFEMMKGITKSMAALRDLDYAKTFWNAARKTGEFLNPLEHTTQFFRNSENLNNMAKSSTLFGSFYRDLREVNFALSESKLEGGSAYLDESQRLTDQFYQQHGRMPVGKELDDIIDVSKSAAYATTLANLPTIYYTNKITFDGLFKGISPLERTTAEFMTKAGSKISFSRSAAKAGLDPFKYVENNFKNAMKSLVKPKTYLKAGLNYFKGNLSEGLQESLQDVISGAAKDYYTNVYNNRGKQGMDDVTGNIVHNMAAQFSGQGLETFLGGFVMGSLIHPITSIPGWTTAGYYKYFKPEQYAQYKEAKQKYTDGLVNNLNEMYKDPLKFFGSGMINLGAQTDLSDKMSGAQASGDTKGWHDLKDASVYEHIWTALDTGTFDNFMDRLGDIKRMDAQTAKEAYGTENGEEVLSKADDIIARARNIKKSYDFWQQRAPNPFDPKKFKKGTPEYVDEAISQRAWDLARKHAVFMNYSFNRTLQRMQSIMEAASVSKPLQKADPHDISVLFDEQSLGQEINLLQQEVSAMSGSTDTETKRRAGEKKERLEKLTEYMNKLRLYQNELLAHEMVKTAAKETKATPEEVGEVFDTLEDRRAKALEDLKGSYRDYMSHLARVKGDHAIDESVDKVFDNIKDIYDLRNDAENMTQSVNMLTDPEGFAEHFRRTTEILKNLYNNRKELIEKGIKETLERKESNSLLNRLYEKNVVMDAEELEAFLKDGTLPQYFYDFVNKVAITQDDPRYHELAAILLDHEQAVGKETPEAGEKPEEKPEAPKEEEASKDISTATPWNELPEALRMKLEPLWEEYRKENLADKEEFELERYRQNWLTTPKASSIIAAYNVENKLKTAPKREPTQGVPVLRTVKLQDGRTLDQLSLAELNSVLRQLKERDAISDANASSAEPTVDTARDERKLDIQDLEDYIARRRSVSPQDKNARVAEIINQIDQMQGAVEGRSEDNQFYIINGEPYQRVTTVVAPVEAAYNGTDVNFTYYKLGQMVEMFFQAQMNNWTPEQYMNLLRSKKFSEFNERKYAELEKALKENFDLETLRAKVNELAYDESRAVGNTLDGLVRSFLQDKPVTKPESMSQEAYDSLIEKLNQIRDNMLDKNLTLLTNNIVVYDPQLKIAGEIDILAIDKQGDIYIYDIKSAKKSSWEKYQDLTSLKSNKIKHQLQVSAYGNLLYNTYGIEPKGYGIVPLEVTYDLDGNIKTLHARNTIKLDYLPDVEEVVPRRTPDTQPSAETPEPGSEKKSGVPETIESATEKPTEQPEVPQKMDDLVGKPIIWQGKTGTLQVATDGTYVLDTGSTLYDITRDQNALPSDEGITLHQVQDSILNKTEINRTIYRATFLDPQRSTAEINGVTYRVNRDKIGNIVSLTYTTNQKEIAELEQKLAEAKADAEQRRSGQKEAFKGLSSQEKNTYLRNMYTLESQVRQMEGELARLKRGQQQRTTQNQDLVFSLKVLPAAFPKAPAEQEKEDIKLIKNNSDSSSDIELADRVMSEAYPDALETFLDKGVQGIQASDIKVIQAWAEDCITRLEAENRARQSTQLTRVIDGLYDLLNDMENIKLTKDGRISKRQGGGPQKVQKRESTPAVQVAKTGTATERAEQEGTKGSLKQIENPLVLRFQNNSELVAAGVKTATSRMRNTTGLKRGESAYQTIYSSTLTGKIEPVTVKVTYLGLLNAQDANAALAPAAARRLELSPGAKISSGLSNFEVAEAFDATTTGKPQDQKGISDFLSGKGKRHIYSLEVVTPDVALTDIGSTPAVGTEEVSKIINNAGTSEQLDKVRKDLLEKLAAGKLHVPTKEVKRMLEQRKSEIAKNITPENISKGEVLIMAGKNGQELYKVMDIEAENTTFEKLNSPGVKMSVPNKELSSRFQGKWTKDMEVQKTPEPSAEEKALINESSDSATRFLSDKKRLKEIADEADKKLDKDASMNDLLNNLDC